MSNLWLNGIAKSNGKCERLSTYEPLRKGTQYEIEQQLEIWSQYGYENIHWWLADNNSNIISYGSYQPLLSKANFETTEKGLKQAVDIPLEVIIEFVKDLNYIWVIDPKEENDSFGQLVKISIRDITVDFEHKELVIYNECDNEEWYRFPFEDYKKTWWLKEDKDE